MAGRPREFDRDEALAKARDAFWKRGYEGVSMSDLVAILDLASSRIYAAFGSKEDLFREAVALYRRSGYHETTPYNDNPYASLWFSKTLQVES